MSTPAIQYSGPVISAEVPWETRRHLQLIYQKLANHTQAFSLQQQQIKSAGGSTTTVYEGTVGGSSPISLGGVNNQSGVTSYETTQGDNGVVLVLNDASAVAVTLNSAVSPPYYLNVTNFGAGLVTFTPTSGTINGTASTSLPSGGFTILVFDGTNWHGTAVLNIVVPANTPSVAGEYFTGYNSATGAFSVSSPAGLSVTITTAKLTATGTNGSQTFIGGILTAETAAT